MAVRREDKFGYGFLFVGLFMPYLLEQFLGPLPALLAAVTGTVAGIVCIAWGHLGKEEQPSLPSKIAVSVLALAAICTTVLFGWKVYEKSQQPVTPLSSPQSPDSARIKQYIEQTGVKAEDVSRDFPDSLFAIHVTVASGTSLIVREPKDGQQYLLMTAGISIKIPEQRRAFSALSQKEKTALLESISMEMSRMSIECQVLPVLDGTVMLQKSILVSDANSGVLMDDLQQLNAAVALDETILLKKLQKTPALSTKN
jgi:hypothetical protein